MFLFCFSLFGLALNMALQDDLEIGGPPSWLRITRIFRVRPALPQVFTRNMRDVVLTRCVQFRDACF